VYTIPGCNGKAVRPQISMGIKMHAIYLKSKLILGNWSVGTVEEVSEEAAKRLHDRLSTISAQGIE
jgi:hypothetical protein